MTIPHATDVVPSSGSSRWLTVLGPRDTATSPNSGINWDPPYPNHDSATSPGVPTGPELDWRSFDGRTLSDGDQIHLSTTQTNSQNVTIILTTPNSITWWKDIEVLDWTGTVRAAAWTADRLHAASLSVPNAEIPGLSLSFQKAKFLGVHTEVYTIANLIGTDGQLMQFNWTRD